MKKLVFILMFLPLCGLNAQPEENGGTTTRYTYILAGNKAGFQNVTRKPDGSLQIHFEFNDRGRGPVVDEHVAFGPHGIPALIDCKGVDYFKVPEEERFSIEHGRAQWKSLTEQGEQKAAGDAFYNSLAGAPEELIVLARALLAAPGQTLPLLPEGRASIKKLSELKVEAGGEMRALTGYEITGLNFEPSPVWLTPDVRYSVTVNGWNAVVPEGWENVIDTVSREQAKYSNARAGRLARELGRKPAGTLAIVHARLFDSESAQVRPNSTVIVTGNKITAVGADGKIDIPKDAEVIDASGRTLLPGLWDMHVHVQPGDGLLHIAAGVTTVRDLANDTEELMKTRDRFDHGQEIGPRIVMAGFIDGRGPYQGPTKVFADSEEEAKKDVDNYANLGYVQIKVYSSLKPELVPRIAEFAHSRGLRLSGHVPNGMNAGQFVRAGADEIQHMNFIFLNFLPQVKDTRGPARFSEVGAHAAEIDPGSNEVKAFIRLLLEHKTVIDPTVSIFEAMFTDRQGQPSDSLAPIAARLPAVVRRNLAYQGIPVPDGMDQRYRDCFRQMLKMTRALYDAGVPIVAGTDDLAGFTLHRELELYEQAGIPATRVLQIATLGAARVMKRDGISGSIAAGKLADMVLVQGDPDAHISDIRKVRTVVKDGVIYQAADLDRAVGVQPN